MALSETPLQIDLFTGTLVDTRTPEQKRRDAELRIPTQMLMFSQRDIAQIGVSPTPRMDLSPGRLALIAEDPRTPEEIEQDRLRAAQDQTLSLFGSEPPTQALPSTDAFTPLTMPIEQPKEDEVEENEPDANSLSAEPPLAKLAAYHALIAAVADTAATEHSSEPVRIAQSITISLATHNAKRAGLTEAEMQAARVIGTFQQHKPTAQMPPEKPKPSPEPLPIVTSPEKPQSDDDIPILWVKRSDFLKRRPDLAPEIQKLNDDELAFLAERVGDALEEFYWIQLNVVLSLFLDHSLALHLDLRKPASKQPKKS